jgi:hypothetical protein
LSREHGEHRTFPEARTVADWRGTGMTFKTVFDVNQQGYTTAWFPALGLIGVIFGALLVFRPAFLPRFMRLPPQGIVRGFFSLFFLIFASVWTAAIFLFTFQQYRAAASDLNTGQYSVAEGPVTDFASNPYKPAESFSVNGHRFSYSKGVGAHAGLSTQLPAPRSSTR